MRQEKPSVLELAMGLDVGGAETHVVSLSGCLKAKGWNVEVASRGGRRVRDLNDLGITHHVVPLSSRNPLAILRAYLAILEIVKDRHFDLIHAHARIPAWVGTAVAKRAHIPLVTTYHWTFVSGLLWNRVTRAGDWTIAVSHDIKRYIVQSFGFPPDKCTVIPNGIDCSEFHPVPGPSSDGPVIVYASRLTKELGATACKVIEAATLLADTFPSLRLLVAGDGDHLDRVKSAAAAANDRTRRELVRCLGFVIDMAPLYQMSDLVVGMSRVTLEAMACGKPALVAGPQGDYGLVTRHNVEDLELRNFTSRDAPRPVDPAVLATEIRTILDALSGESLRQTVDFCLEYVRSLHSVEATTAQVEEVYRKMLARGG